MRFAATVAVFALAGAAAGQSPARGQWFTVPAQPGAVGLWVGNELIGTLDPFEGTWAPPGRAAVNLRKWAYENNPPRRVGAKADCPCGGVCGCDPCKCADRAGGVGPRDNGPPRVPPGGVDLERIRRGGDRYTVGGVEVDRAEALSVIEGDGRIPDDAGLPRLTVIGTAAARKRVTDDLAAAPELAYWRGRFVAKEYEPTHWRVTAGGFVTPKGPGDAVVYCQKPDGTVLWRQDTYTGAPDLARALRDKVPGYDPAKDPSPAAPKPAPAVPPSPAGGWPFNPWWLSAVVAPVAAFLAFRRK